MPITGTLEERERISKMRVVGSKLREVRIQRQQKFDMLAHQMGCTAYHLVNLETGFATLEEYWLIIDDWTLALGVDSTEFKNLLPSLTSQE